MSNRLPEYFITRDTREQNGWTWIEEEKKPGRTRVLGTDGTCLSAGDYAIKGREDLCIIERKQDFAELFGNLMNKDSKERFERELEKLRYVKHKYLIVEDIITDGMMGLTVPQYGFGPPLKKLLAIIWEYNIRYGLVPIFAGSAGKKVCRQIFEQIAREYL